MIKRLLTFLFTMAAFLSNAQEPDMADTFRAEGKIYVVIAVLAVIFLALVIFLIAIERKVKKLEDKIKDLK